MQTRVRRALQHFRWSRGGEDRATPRATQMIHFVKRRLKEGLGHDAHQAHRGQQVEFAP